MNTTPQHNETANELYALLSPDLRAELSKHERFMSVPKGTNLIQHGVQPDELVIVNSGKVEITLNCAQDSVSLDCAELGKVFGMCAVVSGELPQADVTSQENCRVTLIPRDAFLTTLREHPQMYFAIAKVLSGDLVMAHRFRKTPLHRSLRGKTMSKSS
jgi:CRP-like cAMP-binding protein